MDFRRTILWVVFMMSAMFVVDGWQRYNGGTGFMGVQTKPVATASQATPSASAVPSLAANGAIPAATTKPGANTAIPSGAAAPIAASQIVKISNDVLALQIDTAGANIVRAELLKHIDEKDAKSKVLLMQPGAKQYAAQSGFVGPSNTKLPDHSANTVYSVASSTPSKVVLEATVDNTKLVKTITLANGSYSVAVNHTLMNGTASAITPTLYLQLLRHGGAVEEGNALTTPTATFTGPAVYTDEKKFQKIEFSDIEKNKAKFQNTVKDNEPSWVGMVQHYFVAAWVAKENKARDLETGAITQSDGGRYYFVRSKQAMPAIAPGASISHDATLYVGPQDQDALEKLAPGLDLVVDYGIFTIVAKPIFAGLQFFHKLTGNWGWAIVLLTLTIKALLYLPMAMSYRSMAKMKLVAPKMKDIQARYKDDRTKLNTAMMELYRTEKINPLGGCLPILLTIPIFISLYWVLLASVEIRNAPWIGWITNLAEPDQWYVLPVLLAATMWAQFKLNPAPPDPMQAKVMMVMQAVFAVMFLFFPAGLNLYYFVNNLLSIAQQWYITRQLEKEGLQEKVVKAKKK